MALAKILWVDDEIESLQSQKMFLENKGYEVFTLTNGFDAIDFVKRLYNANIERIAIENPIGNLSTAWRKPDQIIQPFHHGHEHWKSTCLWLKNLPLLQPSEIVQPEEKLCGGKKPGRITSELHRLPPSQDRWKERARTYQGIADAMANQWGNL